MAKSQKQRSNKSQPDAEEEILTEVKTKKLTKQEKQKSKEEKIKAKKKAKAKTEKPKRHRVKEIFSELKKVNWPTFKKTCKQTGTVLIVVVVFMLVVLGFDSLLSWLMSLVV